MQIRFSLIRIVAVALLVYSLASLWLSFSRISRAEENVSALSETLAGLQKENAGLKSDIQAAESGEAMEKLARERLGYVMPNEKIFYFITNTDK